MSDSGGAVYVAWSTKTGRVLELSELVGARPFLLYPRLLSGRRLTPLRYLVSAVWTFSWLLWRRPSVVMVINPPVPAAVCVALYGRVSGARVVLDSHPGGFGAQSDRLSATLQPLHRWAVRRAVATLVTGEPWATAVRRWGGVPLVVHEAPAAWTAAPRPVTTAPTEAERGPRVLFLGTFGRDEPVDAVFEAARAMPDVCLRVTGDPEAAPAALLAGRPDNILLLGFLPPEQYQHEVLEADVVVVLTTEPTSVMRAAYEAVYAQRPLVVSDWPGLREVFPHAVHVANTAEGVAAGVRQAVEQRAALAARAPEARAAQAARWDAQVAALRGVVG